MRQAASKSKKENVKMKEKFPPKKIALKTVPTHAPDKLPELVLYEIWFGSTTPSESSPRTLLS